MFRRGLSAAKFADLSINSCDDFEVAVGALVPTACCLLLERAARAAFAVCVPRSLGLPAAHAILLAMSHHAVLLQAGPG